MGLVFALCAVSGVYLVLPARFAGRGVCREELDRPALRLNHASHRLRRALRAQLAAAGLHEVKPRDFVAVSASAGGAAAVVVGLFAGPGLPMLVVGVSVAFAPAALWRRRSVANRDLIAEAWPRLIDEVRIRVGSRGQSIPQALLDAGASAPTSLRSGFDAARRDWILTTDFRRTVSILKDTFADPTADAVCETLLVVHEVGGDLERRLDALAADRRIAQRDRQEAAARQAGARVARLFVIVVPVGMALAGMSLGQGSESYRSAAGQVAVALAVGMIVVCWWWAGRIMTTPREQRVFDR